MPNLSDRTVFFRPFVNNFNATKKDTNTVAHVEKPSESQTASDFYYNPDELIPKEKK